MSRSITKKTERMLAQALNKPICIISNGTSASTQILIDGKPLKGVERVDISIDAEEVRITLDVANVGLILGSDLVTEDLVENEVPSDVTIN